jgi:3-oxoacyl-[acyl-carrier protein] reductase
MVQQSYGRIVITSSITGPRTGNPGLAHYAATKAGINGFIRTAAIEFARHASRSTRSSPATS